MSLTGSWPPHVQIGVFGLLRQFSGQRAVVAANGIGHYQPLAVGRMARENHFQGLFCVVSDPVDPLCRAVLLESNKNEAGELDGQGLFPHQVRGFGLGVMNAPPRPPGC